MMTSVIIDILGIDLPWLELLKWTMVFLKSYPENYWPYTNFELTNVY